MTHVETEPSTAEHDVDLPSGADGVYALLADVTRWPVLFAPCVHADVLDHGPGTDRFRMWAFTGDDVRSWTSSRRLDAAARRIDFEQDQSPPPFASVGGHWRVEDGDRLVLAHHWTLREPSADTEDWVRRALDRNSETEIAAVRRWAAPGADPAECVFTFAEELDIAAPADAVYEFLYRSDLWPARLSHVDDVELTTAAASAATGGAEVQDMRMVTRGPDGTTHETRSVRLCFARNRIVYKQTAVPAPLLGHSGQWVITESGTGVRVVARHLVALDPTAVRDGHPLLGPGRDPADARAAVRAALGGNSLRTLEKAKRHVEQS